MRRFAAFLSVLSLIVISSSVFHWTSRTAHAAGPSGDWSVGACPDDKQNTSNHSWWGHERRVCELRTSTIHLGGQSLAVKSENGGITVRGDDRSDVLVEARVEAWAGSDSEARKILQEVVIETSGDSIRDNGPHFHLGSSGYGINYRIRTPHRLGVNLKSDNGGIEIAHLDGAIRFDTTNGGVDLDDLAGDVHGSTVNGGLDILLTGDRWRGQGLNAETTNGGVSLRVPDPYNAHLETGTVNGGIQVNFPITIQGEIKNRLSTDLGSGGPTIHAETTNGAVEISRPGAAE